jgi:3-methyladenine DNA glycosylase AlkD
VTKSDALVKHVQKRFRALADAEKAPAMMAYMKTDMPFYGIQKPDRVPVYKEIKKQFVPESQKEYEECVLALWRLPHREEKYAALDYAQQFKDFKNHRSLPLYERLVREGAWWDFVDVIAIVLVGDALMSERAKVRKDMDRFVKDKDMWIRRTALLCQNHHKKETDQEQLFDYCARLSHEKEFFIRKAIGWALREYSYTSPKSVMNFLKANKNNLSVLSYREGAKGLIRKGLMQADD